MVADDTTLNLKKRVQENSLIRLSLKGAGKEDALTLLKGIDPRLDVTAVDPVEEDLISFEITNSGDQDFRSDIYLKIKGTDWIIVQLAKESQALEKIFRELTREVA
jgi:ABC-2 type transport system ATP-binding protein